MKTHTRLFREIIVALVVPTLLSACAPGSFEVHPQQIVDENGISKVTDETPSSANPALKFCSYLSFDNIAWNDSLSLTARRSFAIAMSVSGSFEGNKGWENITNSFDGMGLSAGLLNQTLGTGSLQPLLAQMEYSHGSDFSTSFSATHYKSINGMIENWKSRSSWKPKSMELSLAENSVDDEFGLPASEIPLSTLGGENGEIHLMAAAASLDPSVIWAKSNLYLSNGSFNAAWKSELQTMLRKPAYISLQVEAARKYHTKAIQYMNRIGIYELRAYLLMFDFITQNGSIQETRFVEWEKLVKAQGLTNSTAKLKALVEVRLQDTLAKYRADTRIRKYALIDGTGTVHGSKVNLPKSFCYSAADAVQ